jgi:hypothetical protein
MLEIAYAHRIFILPAHSERSPLHDVRQPARRSFDATCETVTSGRADGGSAWRPDWWSQTGSNRRPPACKAGALPTELWPLVQRRTHQSAMPAFACATARQPSLRRACRAEAAERRRLVGLGRLELPTSRLSSARSNQLSYKPLTWRTAERRAILRSRRAIRRGLVQEERETETAASRQWTFMAETMMP